MTDSEIETKVTSFLNKTAFSYEVINIDPEFADTIMFCEKYGFPLENSANTIIVGSKKKPKIFTASVVRATQRIDVNHVIKPLMNVGGGVTVLALPPELPIYIDPGLIDLDYIILGGGSRSTKIKVSPKILQALPNAMVVKGLTGN